MSIDTFPFSYMQGILHVGERPVVVEVTPGPDDIQRMIETYSLVDLRDVSARFELRRWRKVGVAVEGRLVAHAVQACVVTLAPVDQQIDESFSMRFDPDAAELSGSDDGEIEVDAFAEDPPDQLEGGRVDLGAILCEQFALALDPFPRAPGAELPEDYREDGQDAPEDGKKPSPFAILDKLRKRDE